VRFFLFEDISKIIISLEFSGGAPHLKNFTGDRYVHGFHGCIHIVEHLEKGPIKLGINSISGLNVNSCPE
jgi:hypothetical protein